MKAAILALLMTIAGLLGGERPLLAPAEAEPADDGHAVSCHNMGCSQSGGATLASGGRS